MAERTIQLNLDVNAKSGQAAIQRTSTQIKDLGKTSTTSSTAISTGMKTANTQVKSLGKNAMASSTAMKKSSNTMKTGMKATSAQTKSLGTDLQKTSKYIKTVGKDATKSGASVSSSMKNASTNVKSLGTSADKASKQVKGIGASAATSGASIQRTTTQLKGLSAAAIASGAAMGTGAKLGAGGMLLLGAAAVKTTGVVIKLTKAQAMGIVEIGRLIDKIREMIIVELSAAKAMNVGTLHLEKQLKVLDKLGKEYKEYTGHVNKSIDANRKSTKEIDKNTKSISKNNKGLKSSTGLLAKYKTALLAVAAVGFAAVVVSGAKFERKMSTVGGVMRAIPSDMVKLSAAARKMGADSEWGANKAADALKFMGMAGYTSQQAIKALPGVLNLATAAGLDLASVSDIVTDSLTAMGMGVDELSRFNDVLIGVTTRSNTSILMMGESLKYVAPVASQMGYDIEQLSAMLGILANSGIKASDAGTDLRQAMIKNVSVAKKFGKAENDLVGTLEAAADAGWGVTEVTKNYGLIAAKSVLVLMKQIKEFKNLEEELRNVEGETKKLADVKLDTLIGDFNKLKSAAKEFGLVLYDHIAGTLRTIIQEMTIVTKAMANLFDTRPKKPEGRSDIYQEMGFNIKQVRSILVLEDKKLAAIRNREFAEVKGYKNAVDRNDKLIKMYDTEIAKLVKIYNLKNQEVKITPKVIPPPVDEGVDEAVAGVTGTRARVSGYMQTPKQYKPGVQAITEEQWEEQFGMTGEKLEAYEKMQEDEQAHNERMIEIRKTFDGQYAQLGMNRFDIERMQLDQQKLMWEEAGVDKNQIEQMVSDRSIAISRAEVSAKAAIYANMAGQIAGTFQQIAQAGGKHSKKAFMMYKAFAMTQAAISTAMAVVKTYSEPMLPYPSNIAMAAIVGAMGAAKIAMISAEQPPSYDQGGVSNAGGIYQTGNIAEAHIPIPSGGKIPVEVGEKEKEPAPQEINIMNVMNPAMFDEYLSSAEGQDAILNVIGSRSQSVKRHLR